MNHTWFALLLGLLWAAALTAQPAVRVIPLEINTSSDDFASVLTGDGRLMYLTSRDRGDQEIYVSSLSGGTWQEIDRIDELSEGDENGTTTVTPDGQFMVFSALDHPIDGVGRTDLYVAWRRNGAWTDVQNLGPTVNSPYWDSHPYLSSDGRTLYFASDRPGGEGMVDIWISRLINGVWTPPQNAGPSINSEYDDMAPTVAPDRRTLYFASNRPGGIGGFDLYVTRTTTGTAVTNMGAPINSLQDEYFFHALATAERAYLSSNRPEGKGGIDIFVVAPNPFPSEAVVTLRGRVTDGSTGQPIGSEVVVTDLTTGEEVTRMRSDDQSGEYVATLITGHDYSITAERPGYLFHSERYTVPEAVVSLEVTRDISLSPIRGGEGTELMVFFDLDKADLKQESVPELNRVVLFLQDNPEVRVSIEGHTDDRGEPDYNIDLSRRRADAVRDYLTRKGIAVGRLSTVGYGEGRPLVNETTEEARAVNRRVELKVVE